MLLNPSIHNFNLIIKFIQGEGLVEFSFPVSALVFQSGILLLYAKKEGRALQTKHEKMWQWNTWQPLLNTNRS